jgi:Tfp pilus assembly protein PilN
VSNGYNDIIDQKQLEIGRLKEELNDLQSEGKNLSKGDIMSFADLEHDRFLWAQNLEKMGRLTPDDISITGLRFKRSKLIIKGIALTFEDRKDFEIIDEYVQTLRKNKEFSNNFNRIKYVGHSKVNIRGQEIVRFEIEAAIKTTKRKSFS